MHRFFVDSHQINENIIRIIGKDVNHIKNVLRFNLKDKVEIVNSTTKQLYICEIKALQSDYIECYILEKKKENNESNIYIHILQAIPKFEKMEWIIEKCTELGVSEFTPVMMNRCIVKLDSKTQDKKIQRWRKIAEVAAKQSKRDIIPTVNSCISIDKIYEIVQNYDIVLVAYENEKKYTLKQAIEIEKKNNYRVAIIVGPEGGISQEEISKFSLFNFKIVSLGRRILRTETAPIVMVANIIYELERGD